MGWIPDGPLGPRLTAEGFTRIGQLGQGEHRRSPLLNGVEKTAVGAACASISIKRYRLSELPIFVQIRNLVCLTVFVDVHGQVWFARKLVDLSTWGIDDLAKLD